MTAQRLLEQAIRLMIHASRKISEFVIATPMIGYTIPSHLTRSHREASPVAVAVGGLPAG